MPTLSLTTFLDFAAASGTARLTKVRNAKASYDQPYDVRTDFYKGFRDRVSENLDAGWDAAKFRSSLKAVSDTKKQSNYEDCRKGLTRWVGKKKVEFLPVERAQWQSGDLKVKINPELHLKVDGKEHLIKLYLKAEKLSKRRLEITLHLLNKKAGAGIEVGVLDVRRGKLYKPTVAIPNMDALLKAEAAALMTLWESL